MRRFILAFKNIHAPMNSMSSQTLVFDKRTFTNPRVLYAICLPGDRHKHCMLRRFTRIYGKYQDNVHECNVTIEAKKETSAISDKIRLTPLGNDQAIIAYLERTNLQTFLGLISIRFSDCKLYELPEIYQIDQDINKRPYEFELLALATNDSEYYAVYRNSRLCGDEYCKLRVDLKNHIIHGPQRWFKTGFDRHQQVLDLVPFTSNFYRFLILEIGYGKSEFSLVNENNEAKFLVNYKRHTNKTSYKNAWTLAYTTANEKNGICNLLDSTLNCAQYDESGVKVYNAEHRFDKDDDIWLSAMYNLPDDNGILVLLIEHVPNRYKILQLDRYGKQIGHLIVQQFDCDWRKNAIAGQFFENDNDYCVSIACYDTGEFSESIKMERGNVYIVTQCFSLTEFKAYR